MSKMSRRQKKKPLLSKVGAKKQMEPVCLAQQQMNPRSQVTASIEPQGQTRSTLGKDGKMMSGFDPQCQRKSNFDPEYQKKFNLDLQGHINSKIQEKGQVEPDLNQVFLKHQVPTKVLPTTTGAPNLHGRMAFTLPLTQHSINEVAQQPVGVYSNTVECGNGATFQQKPFPVILPATGRRMRSKPRSICMKIGWMGCKMLFAVYFGLCGILLLITAVVRITVMATPLVIEKFAEAMTEQVDNNSSFALSSKAGSPQGYIAEASQSSFSEEKYSPTPIAYGCYGEGCQPGYENDHFVSGDEKDSSDYGCLSWENCHDSNSDDAFEVEVDFSDDEDETDEYKSFVALLKDKYSLQKLKELFGYLEEIKSNTDDKDNVQGSNDTKDDGEGSSDVQGVSQGSPGSSHTKKVIDSMLPAYSKKTYDVLSKEVFGSRDLDEENYFKLFGFEEVESWQTNEDYTTESWREPHSIMEENKFFDLPDIEEMEDTNVFGLPDIEQMRSYHQREGYTTEGDLKNSDHVDENDMENSKDLINDKGRNSVGNKNDNFESIRKSSDYNINSSGANDLNESGTNGRYFMDTTHTGNRFHDYEQYENHYELLEEIAINPVKEVRNLVSKNSRGIRAIAYEVTNDDDDITEKKNKDRNKNNSKSLIDNLTTEREKALFRLFLMLFVSSGLHLLVAWSLFKCGPSKIKLLFKCICRSCCKRSEEI